MMLQLGIVAATIASLALESKDVFLGDVASVSVMRATAASTGAFIMAWQYLSHGPLKNPRYSRIFALIVSAVLLWCISQFLLLILLTDVSLRSTAGLVSAMNLSYNLDQDFDADQASVHYDAWFNKYRLPSTGAWNKKTYQYASFAEYSEPAYEADGVSDTGVTLRAFLPFGTAQEREKLESYKGKATLLDARVTCQVPQIKNATLSLEGRLQGSLAPTRKTPRLANVTLGIGTSSEKSEATDIHPDLWRDFDCFINWHDSTLSVSRPPEWDISLCQLWRGEGVTYSSWDDQDHLGGLLSEFFDPSHMKETWVQAKPYLFLNNTLQTEYGLWQTTGVAETSHERGEWLDQSFWNGRLILSASVCYAAFDFADLDVRISSQTNRTESRLEPVFDRDTADFSFQELRYAMGQDRSVPVDKRGMLKLEKRHWYAEDLAWGWSRRSGLDSYFLRVAPDLAYTSRVSSNTTLMNSSTTTGILSRSGSCSLSPSSHQGCVYPEAMHVSILPAFLFLSDSWAVPFAVLSLSVGYRSKDMVKF